MAAPLTADQAPRVAVRYLDRWDNALIGLVVIPLVLWGAASVFMLAMACRIEVWIAWVPALATTGVMLSTTRMAMRHGMPAHIKQWATYLAAFAVFAEIIVAGLQHSLPDKLQPPAIVMFVIGCLPTLMGAATIKVWASAFAAQDAANAAAEQAARNELDRAETARIETAALAERLRLEQAADARRRADELDHQRKLTQLASDAAAAEAQRAQAAATVEKAVKAPAAPSRPRLVPPPATEPTDALGRPARPSPKRDAALRYLIAQHDDGRLEEVTATEVDKHIGANAYARKHLTTWIADVRAYVSKGAA